ncbi:hypothetical protein [Nocardia thraciensis]
MTTKVLENVSDLLDDRTHHIEFNGHLTNHVKHAVVALAAIGASEQWPESTVDPGQERAGMTRAGAPG